MTYSLFRNIGSFEVTRWLLRDVTRISASDLRQKIRGAFFVPVLHPLDLLDELVFTNLDLIHTNRAIFGYPDDHQPPGKRSFPLQIMAST
jgi:hypothetical protein